MERWWNENTVVANLTCIKFVSPLYCSCRNSAETGDVWALWRCKQTRIFSVAQHDLNEKPCEDRGESMIKCHVNSGLFGVWWGFCCCFCLLVWVCLVGLVCFSNPSRFAVKRRKKVISLLVPPATTNQLLAVASHLTALAKVNDTELCSFQIFLTTSGEFYTKERRWTEVKIQLAWLDLQSG